MRLIFIFFFISHLASSQNSLNSATKRLNYLSDNKMLNSMDSTVESVVMNYIQNPVNCAISIGIAINGTPYFYNYGEIKRDAKKLPQQNTLYEIGSITKTFCGLLLANAVTEKKIKLEDDIRIYLPEKYTNLAFNKTPIQIKHLANHTSGLLLTWEDLKSQANFDSLNPYKNYNEKLIFDFLKTVQINDEPGTSYLYSNFGIALLGIILEKVYNKSFEELVVEKICLPNQMNNTHMQLTQEQLYQIPDGYNENGERIPHWDFGDLNATGGLYSTSDDMIKYLNYNMEENDGPTKLAHQSSYLDRNNLGLAWFIKKTKQGNTLIWQNGGTFGSNGFCGFVKEKKCALVILANTSLHMDQIGIAILNYLQK